MVPSLVSKREREKERARARERERNQQRKRVGVEIGTKMDVCAALSPFAETPGLFWCAMSGNKSGVAVRASETAGA